MDIKFKPLTSLLENISDKDGNLKNAIDELQVDLPHIPVLEKKNSKIQQQNRAIVFALGALQICIGALIVYATSGAAATFGGFMIQSGIKDCINAFRPEVIADLKAYYNSKALEYGMAAALAGTAALAQIW